MLQSSPFKYNQESDPRIPKEYQKLWVPFLSDGILYHNTTKANYEAIRKHGFIEPRDPSPRNWAGMKAVFMGNPKDPGYTDSLRHVLDHVKRKGDDIVRLGIRTSGSLYRSVDPERTFQVASLEPIPVANIETVEELDTKYVADLLKGFARKD